MPIDHNIFGTFGDFIGGVLGTCFAVFGTILVIKTFQKQIESNDQIQQTNIKQIKNNKKSLCLAKIQLEKQQKELFDSQFNTFFTLYNNAIESYAINDRTVGRKGLNKLLEDFLKEKFESKATYGKRVNAAKGLYEKFYCSNREKMSIHFRMLYQLVHFISTAEIKDRTKIDYAKAIRGNMNEAEMIFLRYNLPLSVWI